MLLIIWAFCGSYHGKANEQFSVWWWFTILDYNIICQFLSSTQLTACAVMLNTPAQLLIMEPGSQYWTWLTLPQMTQLKPVVITVDSMAKPQYPYIRFLCGMTEVLHDQHCHCVSDEYQFQVAHVKVIIIFFILPLNLWIGWANLNQAWHTCGGGLGNSYSQKGSSKPHRGQG